MGHIHSGTDWRSALDAIDVVIHLAARVHVMKETAADPLSAFREINVSATRALAESAAGSGVKRFVYVSSIKVNGEATSDKAFSRDDEPRPQDSYATSKLEAEQLLWDIADRTGLEVVVVRPPLVYGAGVGGNFLRLLNVIDRGLPLPIGSVKNKRSMIYNGNLASALIACATHPTAAGKTYLVSDDETLSTPELVLELSGLMGRRARLLHCPQSVLRFVSTLVGKGDEVSRLIESLEVDSFHLRNELGWVPRVGVLDGLEATVAWFVAHQRRGATAAAPSA
jgi:nucleoside-diphosphate-sugar epimerase